MKPIIQRIPFQDVIADDKLMGKLWKKLSIPQQTILLAAYGLNLPTRSHEAAWAILNGNFEQDRLGYPLKVFSTPYAPKIYDTIVGLIGRRSGKSYVTCFAVLYEVLFGGHLQRVNEGEEVVIPYIAQDLPTARKNMKMVGLLAQRVPTLSKTLTKFSSDLLEFYGGKIKIQIEPPSVKTGRGWAMPVIVMDEVGFWYKTAENANPDYEVQASVTASQLQFAPHQKQFIISSPYTEEGILYEYSKAGTDGKFLTDDDDERGKFVGALVVSAPTACMQNPMYSQEAERKFLEKELAKDPDVFAREYLAKFVHSVNGFLTPDLVTSATDKGIKERKISDTDMQGYRHHFVAAMDPAFRHDSFAFSIFHRRNDGTVVQDLLKVWTPDKKLGQKLNPEEILNEIAPILKEWSIPVVYSDQYQLESLQQLSRRKGFEIVGNDFTRSTKPKMYGSLKQLFRTGKIRLLDRSIIYSQLTKLQQKNTPMGGVQIAAPSGSHDDVASVVALGTHMAIQLAPTKIVEKPKMTHVDIGILDMKRKQRMREDGWTSFSGFAH